MYIEAPLKIMKEPVKEIAARVGRSVQSIYQWQKEGCDLTSEESIQDFALKKRCRYGYRRSTVRRRR
jgi:hypothetical protein